jgi:hypothetical protein
MLNHTLAMENSNYFNLTAKSIRDLIKNDFRNIIAKNAIIGEISIPNLKLKGSIFLIG